MLQFNALEGALLGQHGNGIAIAAFRVLSIGTIAVVRHAGADQGVVIEGFNAVTKLFVGQQTLTD